MSPMSPPPRTGFKNSGSGTEHGTEVIREYTRLKSVWINTSEEPAGDPSGHLATTADDISRFMIAHLQQGRYENIEILQLTTATAMQTLAFKPPPVLNGMTLGFFRMDRNEHKIIGNPGDIASFHADLELLPDDNVGFFVGLNSDGPEVGPLTASNLLRFSLAQSFMDRYYPRQEKS